MDHDTFHVIMAACERAWCPQTSEYPAEWHESRSWVGQEKITAATLAWMWEGTVVRCENEAEGVHLFAYFPNTQTFMCPTFVIQGKDTVFPMNLMAEIPDVSLLYGPGETAEQFQQRVALLATRIGEAAEHIGQFQLDIAEWSKPERAG